MSSEIAAVNIQQVSRTWFFDISWILVSLIRFASFSTVRTFGIAYIMTKFTEPIRLGVTIGIVPTIARWLGP
jgi:hypothetical protein